MSGIVCSGLLVVDLYPPASQSKSVAKERVEKTVDSQVTFNDRRTEAYSVEGAASPLEAALSRKLSTTVNRNREN
jgi:hypothetical protein